MQLTDINLEALRECVTSIRRRLGLTELDAQNALADALMAPDTFEKVIRDIGASIDAKGERK